MKKTTEAKRLWDRSIDVVCLQAPALSDVCRQLLFVPVRNLGRVAAVGRKHYGQYPVFVDPSLFCQSQYRMGTVAHEALHVYTGSLERLPTLADDRRLYLVASDIAVNHIVRRMGFDLPPNVVTAGRFSLPEGKTAEWYLQMLRHLPTSEVHDRMRQ